MFKFEIIKKDKKSKARLGKITTPHGEIETPCFVPVGTKATIKSLTPDDLKEIGIQLFFINTYHLHLAPGEDVVKKFGGLSHFMNWPGPTITDSGGFQVFSLNKEGRRKMKFPYIEGEDSLVKISDDGVLFRSYIDGSLHNFTPEESIKIQMKLGADMILSFDECPPYPSSEEKAKKAMERTHAWALRCLDYFKREKGEKSQALYGIIQGGVYKDLREESAKFISNLDFNGIAIGGVAVGESKKEMRDVLSWVTPHLPDEKPRHLLGVGEIDDIFDIIEAGMDTFDCVIPTRVARTGFVFVFPPDGNRENRFRIDLSKSSFVTDKDPLSKDCHCYVCQNFTRGYINHLFRSRELLAYRLITYHNLYFFNDLLKQIREAIKNDKFQELKRRWLK